MSEAKQKLQEVFGFEDFRGEIQEQAVSSLINGGNEGFELYNPKIYRSIKSLFFTASPRIYRKCHSLCFIVSSEVFWVRFFDV